MFRLDDMSVAFHASIIDRVVHAVEITPLPRAPDIALGVINVRGEVIPVVNLRRRFRLPERDLALSDRFVIARTARRMLAIVADAVDGVFGYPEADIRRAAEVMPGIEQVSGITSRKDGILFIHDLDTFLSLGEAASLDAAVSARDGEGGDDAS